MGSTWAGLRGGEPFSGDTHSALLSIRLLGSFQVSVQDRMVEAGAWRLRKATHLVKLLALTPGHRLHRDQLIDALWPEIDPDSALTSFHQALHAARRALEPERAARSSESLLRLHQQVLSLEPAGNVWIDAEAFQSAVTTARTSSDLDVCVRALSIYTGELLPEDLYESWTQRVRDSLREMYLELLLTTARLQEESGTSADAIETLRALIAADPLNEAAYAALMRLYATSGRRDQALRLYQQLSDTLQAELDAEPSAEVTDLQARIMSGELAEPIAPAAKRAVPSSTTSEMPAQPELAGGVRISLSELASQDGVFDRRAELDLLQRAFDTLRPDRGQIVLLAGEPGIGKTRLAEVLAHFAGMGGATVLWARCHEAEGTPAFWPWSQIVRASLRDRSSELLKADLGAEAGPIAQVVPDVRAILPDTAVPLEVDSDEARFRFFESLTTFLVRLSERHPLVLIIDDLQWADRSSLMLLEFLADEIASRRIMLIGTYRDADVGDNVPLVRTLERLNRLRATHRVHLTGFERRDIAQYSEFLAGRPLPENLIETIYQRTNGNPFFLREVVQLLASESGDGDPRDSDRWGTAVPLGVREAVTLRLSHLSDDARQVLIDAAVIGGEFQLEVLSGASGVPVNRLLDLLEEAVSLGVITEEASVPDRFQFTHILVRQTLYEGLIGARRARMHARIGDVIERLYESGADPPLAELAHHFFLAASAGEAERALTYLTRAGHQSMERLAYAEAADLFRRAVEILDRFTPNRQGELFDVLLMLAWALMTAGEAEEARSSRTRSVKIARATGDPERLARAALQMVDLASGYLDWRASDEIALLEEALERLPEGDSPLRVQVMSDLAHALVFDKTRPDSATLSSRRNRLVQEAVSMAKRIDAPELIADALLAAHDVLWTYEDVDERLEISREVLTLATETKITQMELSARAQLMGEYLTKGLVDDADRELDSYGAIATTYHLPINLWSVTAKRAMRAFMRGELDESEELINRARAIGLRSAPEISQLSYMVQMFFLRREQDRLREVEEVVTIEAVNNPSEPFWQCLLTVLYADDGRVDEASRILAELLDNRSNAIARDTFWLVCLVLIADACATLGDAEHASILVPLLQPYASLFVCPGNHVIFLGSVSHYLGRLSTTLERWDDATRHFEDALKAEREAQIPIFEAHTDLEYAVMLAKRGDRIGTISQCIGRVFESSKRYRLAGLSERARAIQELLPTCNSP